MKLLFGFWVAAVLSFGYECIATPICSQINESVVIFTGTPSASPQQAGRFLFSVDERFRGVAPDVKAIQVSSIGEGAMPFQPGEQYLIVASRGSVGQGVVATACSGSKRINAADDHADADLVFLRRWAAGTREMSVQGRIGENMTDSEVEYQLNYQRGKALSGVRVTASNGVDLFRGVSDAAGFYRILVPAPGTYQIAPELAGYVATQEEYEVEVAPDSCAPQNLGLWTDRRVSGLVTTREGRPAVGVLVQLVRAGCLDCWPAAEAVAGAQGEYEFTKVPPGTYVIGVNVRGLPSSKVPYVPRFYPGVPTLDRSAAVEVDGGHLRRLDFIVGERLPTRRIFVEVVRPDWRPVSSARVACDAQVESLQLDSDAQGRAVFEVLTDRVFTVRAARQQVVVAAGSQDAAVRIVVAAVDERLGRK